MNEPLKDYIRGLQSAMFIGLRTAMSLHKYGLRQKFDKLFLSAKLDGIMPLPPAVWLRAFEEIQGK
jgi:hypothetical protein